MAGKFFPTAQDAENAFYEAIEAADLEAMMAVWAEDEEIVCVHPGGPRLAGAEQVRSSWRAIFAAGPGMRIRAVQRVAIANAMLAVHSVHETITVPGESRPQPPVVATNVYLRTATGWRMIVHHASPAPAAVPAERPPAPPGPKLLH